jgi:hypothetical protein
MLLAKRIALSLAASKPCPSRLRQHKIASALFEPVLPQAKFDESLRHAQSLSDGQQIAAFHWRSALPVSAKRASKRRAPAASSPGFLLIPAPASLAHRQRVEETGNRLLEMVEPVVEIRVVAPFFHQTASMSDGGAIALEKVTDLGEAHPAENLEHEAATADSIAHLTREVPTLSPAR